MNGIVARAIAPGGDGQKDQHHAGGEVDQGAPGHDARAAPQQAFARQQLFRRDFRPAALFRHIAAEETGDQLADVVEQVEHGSVKPAKLQSSSGTGRSRR